jgi:hypothetical protein
MRLVNMTQESKFAIAQRGVTAFAKVETGLEQAVLGLQELMQIYLDGGNEDMAAGTFVLKERAKMARWIGTLGELQEKVYACHERGTAVARNNDADAAIPEGYAVIMSGGR